jgi:hypothetical protein
MIRARQNPETDDDANPNRAHTEPATAKCANGEGHKMQLLKATADGGPVILGNGGQIRSTRAAADPHGSKAGHDRDERVSLAQPSGAVRDKGSLI